MPAAHDAAQHRRAFGRLQQAEEVEPGRRRVDPPSLIASGNDLFSTTGDLLAFRRALLAGDLSGDPPGLLTERRNRLRDIPILRYGLGTMIFKTGRLMPPGRPLTLTGHSGATGTWLFHCPELDLQPEPSTRPRAGPGHPLPVHGAMPGRLAGVRTSGRLRWWACRAGRIRPGRPRRRPPRRRS